MVRFGFRSMRVIKQTLQFLFNSLSSSNIFVRRTVQAIKKDMTRYFFVFRRVGKVCEKLLSASLCPSVRPHGTTRLPLDGVS